MVSRTGFSSIAPARQAAQRREYQRRRRLLAMARIKAAPVALPDAVIPDAVVPVRKVRIPVWVRPAGKDAMPFCFEAETIVLRDRNMSYFEGCDNHKQFEEKRERMLLCENSDY